ncbi:MAG: toll/interleukin-1 receptor domain-containing protein [Desulfobacter postgatei]|uniref:toll/interleukin-1 receptor domain-containing protein n=1 Tax=Desulfobacter postgatei TaxID=2293 RepID=UPI0023F04512|nr:toll/interleukin-1 receptor domain-containing protein [Desulfobacter postgatei]MDD4274402.1 toll/interleukin-1 receptor domain-containing protein [Desulfobacter postgatei]
MNGNETRRKIYVSYFREDGHAKRLIDALIKTASDTGCSICYDDNSLPLGESITKFMAEVSEADRIVFLLSQNYFQSRSCMNELLLAYKKQASELQPAVVTLDKFLPGAEQEQKLVTWWHEQSSQNNGEEKDAAGLTTCGENAEAIPVILAWLFGKYNPEFKYRDRLVLLQDDKKNHDQAADEIIQWLNKETEPVRYNHRAAVGRRIAIRDALKSLLEKSDFYPLKKILIGTGQFSNGEKDPIHSLASMKNGATLLASLESVTKFLDRIISGDFSFKERFKESIEELTGLFLIAAMDDGKLHQLIHELNGCGDGARNVFSREYMDFYQILVSALFNKSAVYAIEDNRVVGEGEIKLIETGMDEKAFEKFLEDEAGYMTIFAPLTDKVLEISRRGKFNNPLVGDDEKKWQRINKIMAELGKFYITVEKDKMNRDFGGENVFNKIGKQFPALVQILTDEQKPENILELFIPGFEELETEIQDEIITIYSRLNEIQN